MEKIEIEVASVVAELRSLREEVARLTRANIALEARIQTLKKPRDLEGQR